MTALHLLSERIASMQRSGAPLRRLPATAPARASSARSLSAISPNCDLFGREVQPALPPRARRLPRPTQRPRPPLEAAQLAAGIEPVRPVGKTETPLEQEETRRL